MLSFRSASDVAQVSKLNVPLQHVAQLRSCSVDSGTHSSHFYTECLGNLIVSHAEHVTEHHGDAEIGRELVQRLL